MIHPILYSMNFYRKVSQSIASVRSSYISRLVTASVGMHRSALMMLMMPVAPAAAVVSRVAWPKEMLACDFA